VSSKSAKVSTYHYTGSDGINTKREGLTKNSYNLNLNNTSMSNPTNETLNPRVTKTNFQAAIKRPQC
jgi:hypothetical protein